MGVTIYDHIDPETETLFASHIKTLNDLRSAISHLKRADPATISKASAILEELEADYKGKALYKQVEDIRNNLSGIIAMLLKMKGVEVAEEAKAQ